MGRHLGYEWVYRLMGHIGGLHAKLGNYEKALEYMKEAQKAACEIGDKPNCGLALRGLSNIYREIGNYSKALAANHEEVGIFLGLSGIEDKRRAGASLGNTAIIYQDLGDYAKALEYYEKSLISAREFPDRLEEERNLSNIGDLYIQIGEYAKALEALEQSLTIAEEIKNMLFKGETLARIGEVYKRSGQYQKALEYIRDGMKLLGEQGHKYVQGYGWNSLGDLYLRTGRLEEAIAGFGSALATGEQTGMLEIVWQAHYGLGRALEQKGERDAAFGHYRLAIETIENLRSQIQLPEQKSSFLESKLEVYEGAIELLAKAHMREPAHGFDREAFEYAERAKARAFLELLAESKAQVSQGIDPDLLQRKQRLTATLSDKQRRLSATLLGPAGPSDSRAATLEELHTAQREFDDEYEKLQQETRRRNPKYADLLYPQPITLEQAQKLLDAESALLEYVVGEKASYLFAVAQNDYQLYRLPGADKLTAQVKALRNLIMKTDPAEQELHGYAGQYAGLAHHLYRTLVGPAAKRLAGKKHLIIVPDGPLVYLPFEALLTQPVKAGADFAALPYLIRKLAIQYVPSATVLATLTKPLEVAPVKQKAFLAFADPVYYEGKRRSGNVEKSLLRGVVRGGLARLAHSQWEAQSIAKVFPPGEARLFLRHKASEENVKTGINLEAYKYILFSAHGLLNEEKPQFSSIVLTLDNNSPEDGFLQVHEIFNLKLKADLVILSACQTALGKQVRGEGLIGLTRAFMYAGTPSVVASLWAVSDQSTSVLMPAFFRRLRSPNGADKADALRQAKLRMIKSSPYSHPFYWAGFVLIGKGD